MGEFFKETLQKLLPVEAVNSWFGFGNRKSMNTVMSKRRTLIGNVKVPKPVVYVGEPLVVKVITLDKNFDDSIQVTINGVPGNLQYLQFKRPGRKKILVVASTNSKQIEQRTVEIEVLPRPDKRNVKNLFPIIGVNQNFHLDNGATLRLDNTEEFSGKDMYYIWVIGDGITFTTAEPLLNYSFEDRLDPDKPYTTFNIKLHIKTRDNLEVYSGQTTIAIWNTYYLNKQRGFIQLKVEPDIYAWRDGENYIGRFTIKNLEPEPVPFYSVQIEYLYNDPEKVSTPSQPQKYKWKIGPSETIQREFSLPAKDFPKDAFGFAIHYYGQTKKKLQAFADVYFEVRTNPRSIREITDPEIIDILDDLRNRKIFRNPNLIPLDRLRENLEVSNEWSKTLINRQIQEKIRLEGLKEKLNTFTGNIGQVTRALEGDLVGQECTAENEDNPLDPLVCQLTDEWKWVMVPARFLNARKGDVILSPGGSSAIGGLLRQILPPQPHSHSGIMISNYYRLKHSTASDEWLVDAAAGTFVDGTKGSEGLDPDKLKYAWPGTIEQSIDEAVNGSFLDDPDGNPKKYKIQAFDNETKYIADKDIGIVEPLVVKPDPRLEAEMPQVRQTLHRVADSAKQIHGHYRFYSYTNADIFFDDTYRAPDRGSGWWASNTYPTVCSSMIWAAVKRLADPQIMLEGKGFFTQPSELETADIDAEVDSATRDGLYYYTEEERRTAAFWLYNYFFKRVYDLLPKWPWLVDIFSDAADDMANQVCNTFASDWSGINEHGNHAKDFEGWKNPGDGRAVSPDDIKAYWDAPVREGDIVRGLYGYSEKLIYRPSRLEYRQVSRWVQVEAKATLRGRVIYHGNPVSGAVVKAAGQEQITNSNGEIVMTIPAGSYRMEAGKLIDGWFRSIYLEITLAQDEDRSIELVLEDPSELEREITVGGFMNMVDSESWPETDETAYRIVYMPDIQIGPSATHAERSQIETLGGEVRVELTLRFDWQQDGSVNVVSEAKLFEGISEASEDLEDTKTGAANVRKDQSQPLPIVLQNTEFGGGDIAIISLQITNGGPPLFVPQPAFEISPTVLDFGDVRRGTVATRDQGLTVSSVGDAPVTIQSVGVQGPQATSFSIVSNPPGALPLNMKPGESFPISISFQTKGLDRHMADVVVTGLLKPSDPPITVRGRVVANSVAPAITVIPSTINFGNQTVGQSTARNLQVENDGWADLRWRIAPSIQNQFKWPASLSNTWQTLTPGSLPDKILDDIL